jgi:hypothetical protein
LSQRHRDQQSATLADLWVLIRAAALVIAYWMSDNDCQERRHRAKEPYESHHVP